MRVQCRRGSTGTLPYLALGGKICMRARRRSFSSAHSNITTLFYFSKAMSTPTATEIIHAYRHLYRGLLHGVQFSKPARYIAQDTLRDAFRSDPPSMFNQERINNTVEFLGYAAKEAGLEHKILRNLLLMKSWGRKYGPKPKSESHQVALNTY
jgi:hypothetical protein